TQIRDHPGGRKAAGLSRGRLAADGNLPGADRGGRGVRDPRRAEGKLSLHPHRPPGPRRPPPPGPHAADPARGRAARPTAPTPAAPDPVAVDENAVREAAVREERARATEIRRIGRSLELPDDAVEAMVTEGLSVDAARARAIDLHAERASAERVRPHVTV